MVYQAVIMTHGGVPCGSQSCHLKRRGSQESHTAVVSLSVSVPPFSCVPHTPGPSKETGYC